MGAEAANTYRFYYNNKQESPLVASVDAGDISTEQKMRQIVCTAPCFSRFTTKKLPKGEPRFWMQVTGVFAMVNGIGFIRPLAKDK